MKALELSREYFEKTAFPAMQKKFPDLSLRIAAGLVGNGSECFGYDDEQSRDHDWGIDFFIWLPEKDKEMIPEVSEFKKSLFENNPPEFKRERSDYGAFVNVMTAGDFYKQLIGFPEGPNGRSFLKKTLRWQLTDRSFTTDPVSLQKPVRNFSDITRRISA